MNYSNEDIAFLANSANRVFILKQLVEGPHSRHVLAEMADVSRVTLGRILDELEARDWIEQDGQICEITTLGKWVIEEYLAYDDVMNAQQKLQKVVQWFPDEEYGFHISCLADAEITHVSRADASAPLSQHIRQLDDGGEFWSFSFAITRLFLESCWRHVMDESISFDWVFTSEVLEVLKQDETMSRFSRDMLESGQVEFRLYQGDIPYIVLGSDTKVNLRLADADGSPTALIESGNDAVQQWASSTFQEYWEDGTPVQLDSFRQ